MGFLSYLLFFIILPFTAGVLVAMAIDRWSVIIKNRKDYQ